MTGNTVKPVGGLVIVSGACVTCSRLKYTIKSSGLHNNDYAYLSCLKGYTVGVPFCGDRVSIVKDSQHRNNKNAPTQKEKAYLQRISSKAI